MSLRIYFLGRMPTEPLNVELKEAIKKKNEAEVLIETLTGNCNHKWRQISYRESDTENGHTVGVFNITVVCENCLTLDTLKNTKPLCQHCNKELALQCFDGKEVKGCLSGMQQVWKTEKNRREGTRLSDDPYYTQFGVYICTNDQCAEHQVPKFYVTGGD